MILNSYFFWKNNKNYNVLSLFLAKIILKEILRYLFYILTKITIYYLILCKKYTEVSLKHIILDKKYYALVFHHKNNCKNMVVSASKIFIIFDQIEAKQSFKFGPYKKNNVIYLNKKVQVACG